MVIITEIPEDNRYGVFLSFRGVDTRLGFIDHLYKALIDAKIKTFLDDEEIETGEDLKPELEIAIKASKASIIVLSKNYASSTWCLDELVLILEQRLISDHIVIPIFYHVEPTDVRKQQNSFGDAMAKHQQTMEKETDVEKKSQRAEKMEKWKEALTAVADLKGKDAKGRRETEFIEEIVTNIYRMIGGSQITSLPYLFGMEDSIEVVSTWLKNGSSDDKADILTILGIPGIGKTTLARYVYGSNAHLFERSSFIEGIATKCNAQVYKLLDLQKQLLGDISTKCPVQGDDSLEYTLKIEKALTQRKMFIILDDVGSVDQLCLLLGRKGFHPGSKIIITTKDASLTDTYASSINHVVQPEHKNHLLKGLDRIASMELLSDHAFMSTSPKEGYEDVLNQLIKYCEGHPLALKVLGESLRNQPVAIWEDRIKVLKEETDSRINNVLRTSYDSIPSNNDKKLFKYISCFFAGLDRVFTGTILDACNICTLAGFRNLIDRCLLEMITEKCNDILMMHSLIQEMGRDVVRQESIMKPCKRSLLWCSEESLKVLKQKKGTGNIKGLALNMKMIEKEKLRRSFKLQTDTLNEMYDMMILHLDYIQINGSYENFPEELRWLHMHGFPSKSIPIELPTENLVALDLSYSNIVSFGDPQPLDSGKKRLFGSLKFLDLSFCEHLEKLGSFHEIPILQRLVVRNCISLIEICESLEHCAELVLIDVSYCNMLEKLPRAISKLKKLETLLLDGFNTGERQITIVRWFEISFLSSLVKLSLAHNNLSNESFPMDFSFLSMLKVLCLDGNPIVSMPNCVRSLIRLETLSMKACDMLTSVEHPPSTLQTLFVGVRPSSKNLLRRIVFDPEMSPLLLLTDLTSSDDVVVEGIVKKQPLADVEENLLNTLCWTDLDPIKTRHFQTVFRRNEKLQTQMYYEFGIFSTFYGGKDMPKWISNRSEGKSISFTIPSTSKNLRGLNFCYVQIVKGSEASYNSRLDFLYRFYLPIIRITNITQNHTWIYYHCSNTTISVDEENLTFLSHWMFGMNEMVGGDQITITIGDPFNNYECGFSLVYDDDDDDDESNEEEVEDVLGYYKSWNHIIGGDLSSFQITTGEYILHDMNFRRYGRDILFYFNIVPSESRYKDDDNRFFRAFSKRKSDKHIRAHEDVERLGMYGIRMQLDLSWVLSFRIELLKIEFK
ncbi:disease resistance protein RPV1-like [Rutidosis leptorrhynchoides]|uniref:disease resistance protein RPV1-like n=1 Tax=Rutidosis leptorrhynchoides TaxID=125765 RepID=UPI003A99EA31